MGRGLSEVLAHAGKSREIGSNDLTGRVRLATHQVVRSIRLALLWLSHFPHPKCTLARSVGQVLRRKPCCIRRLPRLSRGRQLVLNHRENR
jgi:hypothetical protein